MSTICAQFALSTRKKWCFFTDRNRAKQSAKCDQFALNLRSIYAILRYVALSLRSVKFALRAQNEHIYAQLPVYALWRYVALCYVLCCALNGKMTIEQSERKSSANQAQIEHICAHFALILRSLCAHFALRFRPVLLSCRSFCAHFALSLRSFCALVMCFVKSVKERNIGQHSATERKKVIEHIICVHFAFLPQRYRKLSTTERKMSAN